MNNQGFRNTFLGRGAGQESAFGSDNVYVGKSAGISNTGDKNVMLGQGAGGKFGTYNRTGSIFIGYQAGFTETGSNLLYIENSMSATPLIWGDFANDIVKIHGTLGIKDAYSFPIVDGANGEVLQTNGSGDLTWTKATKTLIADTDNNTKIQVEKTTNDNLIRFDCNRHRSFYHQKKCKRRWYY